MPHPLDREPTPTDTKPGCEALEEADDVKGPTSPVINAAPATRPAPMIPSRRFDARGTGGAGGGSANQRSSRIFEGSLPEHVRDGPGRSLIRPRPSQTIV